MSLGFHRRGKPNRPKRLRNLTISEVSSVDRGAGEGCEIKLLKRRSETMTTVTAEQVRDANAELCRKANAAPVLPADHYEQLMKRHAVANALAVYQAKEFHKRTAVGRNADDVSSANRQPSLLDEGNGLDWSKVDWNNTEEAAKAHRAEQAYKNAHPQGSHAGENSRGIRVSESGWDNGLQQPVHNPKAVSP
jgi:hypothetical protein